MFPPMSGARRATSDCAPKRSIAAAGTCCTPREPPRKSYVETLLEKEQGPFIAVSDNMRIVPEQIAPWVPGGLMSLGTDGFGRSDTRANLRRFFEVDAESTVIGTLFALAEKGIIERTVVAQAMKDLNYDANKVFPQLL